MTGVYKKEMRSYRATMLGYVFVAFLLAAAGLYFSFNNLNLASPKFESVLQSIQFVFLVFVPILTMRVMAEERRQRTDQLLLTLPLKSPEIILGKYFALVTIFAFPMLVICLYPLILTRYGKINLPVAYFSILGFFLLGCVYLAIGLLCSALTESPVISAVLCFGALLLTYIMETVCAMIPNTARASLISFALLFAALALAVYFLYRQLVLALLVWIIPLAAAALLFFLKRPLLEGSFQKFLSVFYLNGRLSGFFAGLMDIRALFYYLTVIFLVLFFACQLTEQRSCPEKDGYGTGLYRILLSLVVTACVCMVNLIAGRLPVTWLQPDFSTEKLYTLTDTSRNYLETLDREVTLYHICEGGEEDETLVRLLQRYAAESGFITVKQVDPVLYPGFVSGYTEERLKSNSVIVVCGDRSKVVPSEALYTIGTSAMTGRMVQTGFDGEGLLTSAIDYVVSESAPVFYILNANEEPELPRSFLETAGKNNVQLRELNLLSSESVPEDAAGLLILAPRTDYSKETAGKVTDYLEKGGKALIYMDFSMDEKPNLDSILSDYGLTRLQGIILEGDASRFMSYPYCILPEIYYSRATDDVYNSAYVLMPMAQGIRTLDTYRSSISLTPLLATSEFSYNKADVQNMTTAEKEAGDESGPFITGILCEEDIDNDGKKDTGLLYFSSGYLLDPDYNQSVSGGNERLFGNALKYLSGEDTARVAVPIKNMQSKVLSITDFAANFWTVICVFVLPLLCVTTGIVIWAIRRRR